MGMSGAARLGDTKICRAGEPGFLFFRGERGAIRNSEDVRRGRTAGPGRREEENNRAVAFNGLASGA